MTKLITLIHFCGYNVKLKIQKYREIPASELERTFLTRTVCEVLACFQSGYLRRCQECWSLFKLDDEFFVFDPRGIEVAEKKLTRRRATLFKFESLKLLIDQLMESFADCYEMESDESCEVGAIIKLSSQPSDTNEELTNIEKPKTLKKKKCPRVTQSKSFFSRQIMMLRENEPIFEQDEQEQSNDCAVIDEYFCAN